MLSLRVGSEAAGIVAVLMLVVVVDDDGGCGGGGGGGGGGFFFFVVFAALVPVVLLLLFSDDFSNGDAASGGDDDDDDEDDVLSLSRNERSSPSTLRLRVGSVKLWPPGLTAASTDESIEEDLVALMVLVLRGLVKSPCSVTTPPAALFVTKLAA